jgi:ribosomal protein S18 acetylase RimI-like enzyme
MPLRFRRIDLVRDRDFLLEMHCLSNYESETAWARGAAFGQYRAEWLATPQPEQYLSALAESLRDERTVAEVCEVAGAAAGYLWVTFTDVPVYGHVIAEVSDIALAPEHQRRGFGQRLLERAEGAARRRGATLLRSETGAENAASQRLHEKSGFRVYRLRFEKALAAPGGE